MVEEQQTKRSVSRKFLKQIETEAAVWKQRGTITDQQADSILSQYVVVSPLYGRLIVILVTLGAILAGVGIILLISSNWQEIPRAAKIVLMIVLVAALYLLGYWLKYNKDFPRAGGAIIFVGAMAFGASLFLVGQQYHLPIDDPRMMIWWFIGVIPIAYFTRSRAVLILAVLAGFWGLGYKIFDWLEGMQWAEYAFFAFYLALGLALYVIGTIHAHYRRARLYASIYTFFGLILVFGVTYILSFKDIYSEAGMVSWEFGDLPLAFIITFNITVALAIFGAVWGFVLDTKQKESSLKNWADMAAVIVFAAVSYLVIILPFSSAAAYAAIFNILLFGGVIGLIFLGYFKGSSLLVNVGLLFFGLGVIGRYFDFAWDLLPRSAFFIVGGLILLGVGILLERLRRKTLERMKAIEVSDEDET